MKKFVSALVAVSALAIALPAAAAGYDRGSSYGSDHGRGGEYDRGGDYGRGDYGRGGYGQDISRSIERLSFKIDRSLAMRPISYREGQRLQWQVREVKQSQRSYWRNDGRLSGWERADLQRKVDRIEASLRWQRNDDDGWRGGDRGGHRY